MLVITKGRDAGRDPSGWAWIDVVSFSLCRVLSERKLGSHSQAHFLIVALDEQQRLMMLPFGQSPEGELLLVFSQLVSPNS